MVGEVQQLTVALAVSAMSSSAARAAAAWLCWALVVCASAAPPPAPQGNNKLLLLHTNDLHSYFEQTTCGAKRCADADASAGRCVGGVARLAHVVREARDRAAGGHGPQVLYLDAGDVFQETSYFFVHKWKVCARFINILKPDVMTLGNHEFDLGVDGLVPYLENVTSPVVVANLDVSRELRMANTRIAKSKVLTLDSGARLGVIGYLTNTTLNSSMAKDLSISIGDEVKAVDEEARKLKAQGVNLLIALGHSGYDMDQIIAREVHDIDVVVGGHSHTLLYNDQSSCGTPEGRYPTFIRQKSGKKVPVVQAYFGAKYLGELELEYDDNGDVTSATGRPLFLDQKVPEDKQVLAELEKWKVDIKPLLETIANTSVFLDGHSRSCRKRECVMGNIVTDAMIYQNMKHYRGPGWTDAPIAVISGANIRASINATSKNGNITTEDVIDVLPYENDIYKVSLTGRDILEMLEWGVNRYRYEDTRGPPSFLQVSGLKVTFNLNNNPGAKVVKVQVRCGNCSSPSFSDLWPEEQYNVLMQSFMKEGGDGFSMVRRSRRADSLGVKDYNMVAEYLKAKSPVVAILDDRISFEGHGSKSLSSVSRGEASIVAILLLIVMFY